MSAPFEKYVTPKVQKPKLPPSSPETKALVTTPDGETTTAFQRFQDRRKAIESRLKKQTYKEQMIDRVSSRLDALDAYLSDDTKWMEKLEKATLRDIAIFEGVYTDKLRDLMGHSTPVVTVQHQQKVDQLLPALMQILQQRGLTVTATERKIEVQQT